MKLYIKFIIGTIILIPIGYFIWQIVAMMVFASAIPSPDDIPLEKEKANSLKDDFVNYCKIYEMDDATRC